jgi:type I restriction enzyme, S subunit
MEVNPGYLCPKGYKQTEVGVVPEDWDVARLGECLETPPGYGINAPAVRYSDRLPAYVRITDITEEGRLSPDDRVSVRSEMSGSYYLADGDIVFARTGASVGKSYRYNPDDGPLVYAGFLIRVRPNRQKLLPAFAAAYATTAAYWSWVRLMSMRSGQPGINGKEYAQLPIPRPPLPEQRAIAAALSDMDALLAKLGHLIAKKRDLKHAAVQELMCEKPGDDVHLLREVSSLKGRIGWQGLKQAEFTNNEEEPFLITGMNFKDGAIRWHEVYHIPEARYEMAPEIQLRPEDVLMTKDGTIGKVLYIDSIPHPGKASLIATILSDMDAEIAALEARRDKTRTLKQGMMQELLTGRIRLV